MEVEYVPRKTILEEITKAAEDILEMTIPRRVDDCIVYAYVDSEFGIDSRSSVPQLDLDGHPPALLRLCVRYQSNTEEGFGGGVGKMMAVSPYLYANGSDEYKDYVVEDMKSCIYKLLRLAIQEIVTRKKHETNLEKGEIKEW